MRLFGHQHAQLAPVVPLSLGMGGRGGICGAPGHKKYFFAGTFACGGHTGSTKLFYQLALAGCHPATRMVLLANFWGRGVFGQVQTILLGECFFLLAQTPLKLMGILKSPYSTGLDI